MGSAYVSGFVGIACLADSFKLPTCFWYSLKWDS